MLNLARPTSWYFDICRQIVWYRLSFDRLYILYNEDARSELETIWCAAITRAMLGGMFSNCDDILDTAIELDDSEWSEFTKRLRNEGCVDISAAIDEYFEGRPPHQIIDEIEGGGYRA